MKLIITILIVGFAALAAGSCSSEPGVPSPPCPQNYLFSCQPNLVPVPCSAPPAAAPAASYGSSGAYSEPNPHYAYIPEHLREYYYQ
ncbi:vitelline membrane protein Vm32E [Drosophila innubila]|uniref:vitelline membrane protein Vm32E n=1 Tax=Drosophila innubila TaxID=198719 RepID=UPI00148D863E|nr:vitelline membrane protein Vm32E [Drosophila innubila]